MNKLTKYITENPLLLFFKLATLIYSINLFIERTWVGEDAFIFFKYVANFVNGNGLVFNVGERVEGFTAPLWVFVLAIFKVLTGAELRPIAIILGLILSGLAITLLLFADKNGKVIFPIGVALLVTNSAFRDFATSGFETSLTYLLVITLALVVKDGKLIKRTFTLGLLVSLLILNRPEAFLVFAYLLAIIVISLRVKVKINYFDIKEAAKRMGLFLLPVCVLVGGYQLFRMGYFAHLLPTTFYAKKGGDFYIVQGFNYIKDFTLSYPLSIGIILICVIFGVFVAIKYSKETKLLDGRLHLIIISGLLSLYILYSGGDYMHGRSLLMAFIFICVAINDVFDLLLQRLIKNKYLQILIGGGAFILVFIYALDQKPYTVENKKEINNINDERAHFGVTFKPEQYVDYINLPITDEFGWKSRGLYYKEVADAIDMPFSIVNRNIGFFGYAIEEKVAIRGAILIDPFMAKLPVPERGKIGHENPAYWDYVLSTKPTFSYTPFKEWNDYAQFKYLDAEHVAYIKDNSDDSFVPILDISNKQFIERFSKLVGKDIMLSVNNGQRDYLTKLTKQDVEKNTEYIVEYIGFLKFYWYPYTTEANQNLFDEKLKLLPTDKVSTYEIFMQTQDAKSKELWQRVTIPLNIEVFMENIVYALKHK